MEHPLAFAPTSYLLKDTGWSSHIVIRDREFTIDLTRSEMCCTVFSGIFSNALPFFSSPLPLREAALKEIQSSLVYILC